MGNTEKLLDDIRTQIEPDDVVVKEAKDRRGAVVDAAMSYGRTLRSFSSGSLAHGTAICPIHHRDKGLDADCAVILSPRLWPRLGPETAHREPPNAAVELFRRHVEIKVRAAGHSKAEVTTTKRAILVEFHQPLAEGEDPTVDLIVGLPRAAGGIWIPNLDARRWDPSHPEKHTSLFLGPDSNKDLRRMRARAVRLAKAENKRTDTTAMCSFNIEALAIMHLTSVMPLPKALLTLWTLGAADLRRRLTPDPAHVSADIKNADRMAAAERWHDNAVRLGTALQADNRPEAVAQALRPLWPEYVPDANGTSKARTQATYAAALRAGKPTYASAAGGLSLASGTQLKRPRSFGDR